MTDQIRLDEDWYVNAEFDRGARAIHRIVKLAEARGLTTICLTERVRRSSDWLRDFTETARLAGRGSAVDVNCAVEAEILDADGRLDAPPSASLADFVFLSCSALPTPYGPLAPVRARELIATGKLLPAKAIEWLARAAVEAVRRYDDVVLLRPFNLLQPLGLDRRHLHPPIVRWLAGEMARREARCVVDERLQCPDSWVVDCFLTAGVTVSATAGGDLEDIGDYEWCRTLGRSTFQSEPVTAFATLV
jgi:hypothetical protein